MVYYSRMYLEMLYYLVYSVVGEWYVIYYCWEFFYSMPEYLENRDNTNFIETEFIKRRRIFMAMKRMVPIKLSEEERNKISSQLNVQEITRSVPKSLDPKHFPVFEVQVGKKVLIYVPNHTITTENGEELLMDKPLVHTIQHGKRYNYYRCMQGIVLDDANGNTLFDGTCPFCDGTDVPWDLANMNIKNKCQQMGLDPEDKENSQVKAIRSAEFSARAIKEPNRYYTFPIVVINTVNDDGKTIAKDDNGKFVMTPMWYSVSEAQYKKTWMKTFEGMEDEPSHPGGRFFTLSYVYETKGKEPNKRDAAQNLAVYSRVIKNSEKLKELLDKSTAEWTPAKAQETVVNNLIYPLDSMKDFADSVLEHPREMLSLLQMSAEAGNGNGNAGGYNLQVPEAKSLEAVTGGSEQVMDATDDDIDFE